MNVENLEKEIDNANNITKLSKAFDDVTNALNKSCDNIYKSIIDYKFSTFLYKNYILLNKSKKEISNETGLAESTVYYYIKKYNIKKSKQSRYNKMMNSLTETFNEKYGVDFPGQLPQVHKKRIENILNKTNGNYSKNYYKKLNKSDETKEKMKISQQYRRKLEKLEGDNYYE